MFGPRARISPSSAMRSSTPGIARPTVPARGANVMKGYFNKPAATAEAVKDGWFHTGDIGHIDAEGYLTITDRKKDLLVTSGGKKIAPQPIEAVLKRCPLIAEVVVLGDGRRFASALIVLR